MTMSSRNKIPNVFPAWLSSALFLYSPLNSTHGKEHRNECSPGSAVPGDLEVAVRHLPSGEVIKTDAPTDNGGRGAHFSPTDLLAAGLSACVLTIMGLVAKRENIPFADARIEIEKQMQDTPRRIGRLTMTIHMPAGLSQAQKEKFERAADLCPVKKSLHEAIEVTFEFRYPD